MAKRKITAREILADLKSNMNDPELMGKYKLSASGLQSVFNKLVKAGLITQAELDSRATTADRTVDLGFVCPSCGYLRNEEFDQCPRCGFSTPTYITRERDKERRKQDTVAATKVITAKRGAAASTIALPPETAGPPEQVEEQRETIPDLSNTISRSRLLIMVAIAAYALALVVLFVMLLVLPSNSTITVAQGLIAILILQVPVLVLLVASFMNLKLFEECVQLIAQSSKS